MEHPKPYYQAIVLSDAGYSWGGWWDNRHHFIKRPGYYDGKRQEGYAEIECTEEQITNGDLEFFIKHGLSYPVSEDHP